MKKLLLILLCLPMIGFGQGWEKTFGGYVGNSVQQTTDGGYIIGGYEEDVYLLKTDGSGNELWSKTYGTGSGSSYGESVQQTIDGGYIIVGTIYSNQSAEDDIYLIKTDGNGNQLWYKLFGGPNNLDLGYSVQQTTDGGYIIAGSFEATVYLIKTDDSGNELWAKTYVAGSGGSYGYSVQQTSDGGYIIVAEIWDNSQDVYLIKTDGNGNELWTKTFGGLNYDEYGYSVQQTSDGGYVIAGSKEENSFSEIYDVHLIKTDGNGNELWTKTFGVPNYNEYGRSVQQTSDGGYVIAGASGLNGYYEVYLIKTDGNGNVTSTFNIPVNLNRKLQKTVDILGKQTKPQTNQPLFYIYDDGTVEKRIVIE